jgi:hypothetical protein
MVDVAADPMFWSTAERVDWRDLDERRRTLERWCRSDAEPWFAADGPEIGGLQRVVLATRRRQPDDPVPALLESSWYPADVVPACLPTVLCLATERVLAIEPGDLGVLAEAVTLVRGLVPPSSQRGTLMAAAAWLERVADRVEQPAPPTTGTPSTTRAPSMPTALDDADPGPYAAHRLALADHCERVAPAAGLDPDEVRQRIVARLLHATNVLGRLAPDDLRTEARLLLNVAA